MKHYRTSIAPSSSIPRQGQQSGFALIATISVMVLLVMIALAMLSLSTIELRSSQQGEAMAEAQANARMALMIALGELQKNAGPDQRVTAEAAILEDPADNTPLDNRHWVGVWRSDALKGEAAVGGTPIIHRSESASGSDVGSLVDRRAADGSYDAQQQAIAWLVSHHTSPDPTVALSPSDSILLVGPHSASETKDEVWASRIPVSRNGQETGGMAWWIGDEGVKSRFDLVDAMSGHAKDSPWQVAAQSGISIIEGYENYETIDDSDVGKIITRHSTDISGIPTSAAAAKDARLKNFHDLTFSSAGLLTDTFRGGLRRDLSFFLANGSAPDLGSRKGLQASTPILDSDKLKEISARFGLLHDWNNLGNNLSSSGGIDPIHPKNLANGTAWGWTTPNTLRSGINLLFKILLPSIPS